VNAIIHLSRNAEDDAKHGGMAAPGSLRLKLYRLAGRKDGLRFTHLYQCTSALYLRIKSLAVCTMLIVGSRVDLCSITRFQNRVFS
jgi:hypothetical protein